MVGDADSGEEKHMSISFADFLDVLYGDAAAAYTTVSVKLTDGRFVCQTFSLAQRAEIVAYIQKHINYDIYIKRASQYVRPERGSSGSAEIAYYQRVITADIDIRSAAHAKDALPASKDDALRLLAESGLPEPTLIVHTGNGLMPMWVLRTPQWINDVAPIQAGVEAQLRLTAARYGWTLDNTSDAARSIRVVGSYNWKQRPQKKPVAVIRNSDRYYDLSDLAAFARKPLLAPKRVGGAATRETIETLLRYIPGDGLEYNKWLAAVWAIQSALPENDAAEVLDKWTYDWEKHQKPDHVESGIGVLINLARERGFEGAAPGLRGGYVTSPELPDPVRVNQRYLDIEIDPDDQYPNIVVIRSQKGTGKTQWLAEAAKCYPRVLSVGHRVSLVRQSAARLNLTPYYEDGRWITDAPRVATTIHSLDKIETDAPYDLVIIDEIEQVLKAIVNDRNLKSRKVSAVGALMEHLRKARLIILADADVGEATVTFIQTAFPDSPIAYVENEYAHRPIDHLVLLPSPEDVLQKSLEWYDPNECKIALACNTRADADRAELFYRRFAPDARVLKITSETSENNNETLERINDILKDVDIFIYSPSVGTGVSIDIEGFALFGIARNGVGVGDVDDFRQQLGRIRNPLEREINVYVETKRMNEPTAPDAYRDIAKLRELEADFRVSRATGTAEPATEWDRVYLDLYCVVKAKTAAQKNAFFDNFVGAYAAEGVEVWDDRDKPNLPTDRRRELAKALREQREAQERARAERIASAPAPDEAKNEDEKRDAERKVELEERYGIDVDAELVLDDERGAYGQAQRFAAVEDAEIAKALDETEATRRFSADRNRFALFAVWFAALLAALKLRIEEGAEIAITEEFVDLVDRNRLLIQAALGIKVREDFRRKPMSFVGALFARIGVGIEGKQQRVDGGKRVRVYRLVNVERARLRTAGIRKRHQERSAPVYAFLGTSVTTRHINKRKSGVVTVAAAVY
jgi:hypothetical protein